MTEHQGAHTHSDSCCTFYDQSGHDHTDRCCIRSLSLSPAPTARTCSRCGEKVPAEDWRYGVDGTEHIATRDVGGDVPIRVRCGPLSTGRTQRTTVHKGTPR